MLSGASPQNQTGPGPGVMWGPQNAICGSRGPLETQEPTKVVWFSAFFSICVRVQSTVRLRVVNLYSFDRAPRHHPLEKKGGHKSTRKIPDLLTNSV